MTHAIKWLEFPEEHDYPAALSYLTLHFNEEIAASLVERLRAAPVVHFAAKDILRASGLRPLDASNAHVQHNRDKVHQGKELSPVLLVRSDRLLIADGFHRCCAIHLIDEDASIPCKII